MYTKIKDFQEKMDKEEREDIWSDDGIVCPKCGQLHEADCEDSAFYEDGDHEFTCGDCDHEFTVDTCVSFSYTTKRDGRS